jgi:hypothetical protein
MTKKQAKDKRRLILRSLPDHFLERRTVGQTESNNRLVRLDENHVGRAKRMALRQYQRILGPVRPARPVRLFE